jgi:hypothetical protein
MGAFLFAAMSLVAVTMLMLLRPCSTATPSTKRPRASSHPQSTATSSPSSTATWPPAR